MNQPIQQKDHYDRVFEFFNIILREAHKRLNFGHITVFVERKKFNIRWTVRRKSQKKFIHDIPLTFNDLGDTQLSHGQMQHIAREIVEAALCTIPKEVIIPVQKDTLNDK